MQMEDRRTSLELLWGLLSSAPPNVNDLSEAAWRALLTTADRHHVLPLLDRSLVGASEVPLVIRKELKVRTTEIAFDSLAMSEQLLNLLQEFDKAGIDAVPFKGPTLATLAYGDVRLRPSLDLDVFVPRGEALEARKLLGELGFAGGPTETTLESWIKRGRSVTVTRPAGPVVDLQWAPDMGERITLAPMFQRTVPISVAGRVIKAFSLDDQLILLSIHGAKHLWSHLVWIADIAHLLRKETEIDWDRLAQVATREGARTRLLVALDLATRLDGAGPSRVIELIARDHPNVHAFSNDLLTGMIAREGAPSPISSLHLRLRDNS